MIQSLRRRRRRRKGGGFSWCRKRMREPLIELVRLKRGFSCAT